MAEYISLEAEARERAGKGAARATRRQGRVPAVIYGARQAPQIVSLDPRDVLREIGRPGWRSRLYEVKLAGETTRTLIRDVQFHPVSETVEHVDLQRLAPGEKVKVAVTLRFLNENASPGLKRGGVLNIVRHMVECWCDPDHVPPHFDADLSSLDINDNVRWSDLKGTEGIRPAITARDFVVVTVAPPTKLGLEVGPAEGTAAAATTTAAAPVAGETPAAAPAAAATAAAPAKAAGRAAARK
jgi:large subunit ribosomal protein L25